MSIPADLTEIVNIQNLNEFKTLKKDFPDTIIITYFWTEWCTQCKAFSEIFKQIQQEYISMFIFSKVNASLNQSIPRLYRITFIPTVLFIKNGNLLNKTVGTMNYDNMKILLEKFKNYND